MIVRVKIIFMRKISKKVVATAKLNRNNNHKHSEKRKHFNLKDGR